MSHDHDGYDGWMGDDQPRPPGRADGKGDGEGPKEEPLKPGEFDVTIQALATSDRQRVLVIDHEGTLVQTDQANLLSIKARGLLVERVRDQLKLDEGQCERLAERLAARWLEFFKAQQAALNTGVSRKSAAELLEEMPEAAREEAETLLRSPCLMSQVVDDVHALGVAGEDDLITVLYLTGVSRLLPKPLSARIHGPSSSGKSFLIDQTASLFPPETILAATTMTPQALYHTEEGDLKNRWVIAGERSRVENDEKAEGTKALREMQASGKLSKLMPVKIGGEIKSVLIEREGPIAFTESTTRNKVFDEDSNRCVALHTDETPEQTRRVIAAVAAGYGGNGRAADAAGAVRQKHWAMQRLLAPCDVVVPYAGALGRLLKCEQLEMRRGVTQLLSTVRALALLHQYQRGRDPQGRLLATEEDYIVAVGLLNRPMAKLMGTGASRPSANFFGRLKKRFGNSTFSTTDVKRSEKSCKSSVHDWLVELQDLGHVEQVEAGRGPLPATWKIPTGANEQEVTGLPHILPSVEDLMDAWKQEAA
jgi:hypothetical protein